MEHPDLLLKLHEYKHRDRLRDVETWRLARSAGQPRANYIGQLLRLWGLKTFTLTSEKVIIQDTVIQGTPGYNFGLHFNGNPTTRLFRVVVPAKLKCDLYLYLIRCITLLNIREKAG